MTDFIDNSAKVRGSKVDGISSSRRKIKIKLALKDNTEELIFTSTKIFYLLNSLSNFVSLGLINNTGNYLHNKHQTLYDLESQKKACLCQKI